MIVSETKNPYVGRLQRGKLFISTLVVSLLNQDFVFLGLEEEKKEMDSCKMTTPHLGCCWLEGEYCVVILLPFSPSSRGTLEKSSSEIEQGEIPCLSTTLFSMVLEGTFWMYPETEVLTTYGL